MKCNGSILKDFVQDKETAIMCFEPSPGLTIEKAKELFEQVENEFDLAQMYATVDNKAWWIADDVYDYEIGTKEYEEMSRISKDWFALADVIRADIFEIIKSEGVEISERGYIKVLEPFMKRNGYCNGSGWWIVDK